jgi:hypothetical protein
MSNVVSEFQPENRAAAFGFVLGTLAACSCVGPFLSTSMSDSHIFFTCLVLSVAHLVYTVCILPESLPLASRRALPADAWNPIKAFAVLNRYPLFRRLALVVLCSFTVLSGTQQTNDLYSRSRFDFTKVCQPRAR